MGDPRQERGIGTARERDQHPVEVDEAVAERGEITHGRASQRFVDGPSPPVCSMTGERPRRTATLTSPRRDTRHGVQALDSDVPVGN